jgi:hypothetical protein
VEISPQSLDRPLPAIQEMQHTLFFKLLLFLFLHTRNFSQSMFLIHQQFFENHELATRNAKSQSDDRSKLATPGPASEKGKPGVAIQYGM